jgi:inhibitor of KinA sporulation pathway (predicted exonuclease)
MRMAVATGGRSVRYVIVDVEATCWEKGTTPRRPEIIEIGAVILAPATFEVTHEFASFVRPVAVPAVSEFCQRLTGIDQAHMDAADDFAAVLARFLEWIGPDPFVLASWGAYDPKQFEVDCARHRIQFPAPFRRHLNLKKAFADLRGIKPCGMKQALRLLGIPLDGTHHRALDDAKNIARIARLILPALKPQGPPALSWG